MKNSPIPGYVHELIETAYQPLNPGLLQKEGKEFDFHIQAKQILSAAAVVHVLSLAHQGGLAERMEKVARAVYQYSPSQAEAESIFDDASIETFFHLQRLSGGSRSKIDIGNSVEDRAARQFLDDLQRAHARPSRIKHRRQIARAFQAEQVPRAGRPVTHSAEAGGNGQGWIK